MVCQESEFHSPNKMDQDHSPSESCVFLPTLTTEVEMEVSPTSSSTSILERGRRLSSKSSNLGILVISEGIQMDPEKVPFEIAKVKEDAEPVLLRTSTGEDDVEFSFKRPEKRRSGCSEYTGILLTLASGLVFTIGGVIVKYMKDYHPFTLAIFRFQGILLPSVFMVLYAHYVQKVPVFQPIWPLNKKEKFKKFAGMILRCVFGTTALFLHFYALQRIDVADALVIGSCQPVFVTILAYFFLGEVCGVFPVVAALLSILGVGVISRPPILTGQEAFDEETLIGSGFSVAAMLTATAVLVIIRYLKDVHVSLLTLVLGCWGTIQSIICSVIVGEFKVPHDAQHWALAGALALVTLIGQVMLTLALQCEQAGPVSLVRTADCVTAFILQFFLLNVVPDIFSLVGASIIIVCVMLTAFRKWVSTLHKNHPARKRFWFVMV